MKTKIKAPENMPPSGHARRCVSHLSNDTAEVETPTDLLQLAKNDPVNAAQEAQYGMSKLDEGFRKQRLGYIAAAYASAYYMDMEPKAWISFIADPGWAGLSRAPKNSDKARSKILLYVMRYVFRAEGNKVCRRVRVYAGMLQDRFEHGFKPDGVIPLIEERGIEDLRKEAVAKRHISCSSKDKRIALPDLPTLDVPTSIAKTCTTRYRMPQQSKACIEALNEFYAKMLRSW